MSCDQEDDASLKFWNNPDLMENLLPFLDVQSTLNLARSKISKCLDLLQDKENPSNWRNLIKSSIPDSFRLEDEEDWNLLRATFEQMREQMSPLIDILKLMKDSNSQMQDLLKVLCEKSSIEGKKDVWDPFVEISHSSHGSHQLSPLGFLILEAIEVEFDSALYEIIEIWGPWSVDELSLSAFAGRLSRQNRKMTWSEFEQDRLMSTSSAEALCTLIQNCETTTLCRVRVSGNIEAAGWAALARLSL